ncbi:MAG: DUF1330 domain-containing protein [Flavobacteriales bacterium]|nr:DUF1330 domain-containing protein [Flavobacteriales bacterium]
MDDKSRYEILVGLHVSDDDQYDLYRAGMLPLLEALGGFFRYDLRVSEHLKGDADDPYNRVFIISFPDEDTKDQFFNGDAYKAVRAKHFDASVKSGGIIASYAVS